MDELYDGDHCSPTTRDIKNSNSGTIDAGDVEAFIVPDRVIYVERNAVMFCTINIPGYRVTYVDNAIDILYAIGAVNQIIILTELNFDNMYKERVISLLSDNNTIIDLRRPHDSIMLRNIMRTDIFKHRHIIDDVTMLGYTSRMRDHKYILKVRHQARGIGKAVVTRTDLISMQLDAHNDIPASEFNDKYNIDNRAATDVKEREKVYNAIKSCDFYLEELVEFMVEFRVIYVEGVPACDYIVEQRYNYSPLSNLDKTRDTVSKFNIDNLPYYNNMLAKAKLFGDEIGLMSISLDLYITKCGEIGIFEYSTEFGIDYPDDVLGKLSAQYSKSLKLAIEA